MRSNFASGALWEDQVGYSRAVRIGDLIEVSGTTAANGVEIVGKGDPYQQTIYVLKKIERVLIEAGAEMKDVIRTRMFVTDISQWEDIGRAHREIFRQIKPATSMVEVRKLIHPDLLVEIEATARLSA